MVLKFLITLLYPLALLAPEVTHHAGVEITEEERAEAGENAVWQELGRVK